MFARVVETGLVSEGMPFAYFLTLTAPGDAPHRRLYQGRRPSHRPECSCWDTGVSLAVWNRGESGCWNRLRTAMVRCFGTLAYIGAVEPQKRGALHRHLVIRSQVPLSQPEVQALALEAGYGCALDLQVIGSAAAMARYLSKYVTKGGDRGRVPWEDARVNTHTGEITVRTTPTYRLRSQSRAWGCTAREVRAVFAAQARARAGHLRELEALLATSTSRSQQGSPPPAEGDPPPT